jgi:hypothetical protein
VATGFDALRNDEIGARIDSTARFFRGRCRLDDHRTRNFRFAQVRRRVTPVGDHIADRDNSAVAVTRPIQRCQTVGSYRQILTGYQVTYSYNGPQYDRGAAL